MAMNFRSVLVLAGALALAGCNHNLCANGGNIEIDRDDDGLPDCVEDGGINVQGDEAPEIPPFGNSRRQTVIVQYDEMFCKANRVNCELGSRHAEMPPAVLLNVANYFKTLPYTYPVYDADGNHLIGPDGQPVYETGIDVEFRRGNGDPGLVANGVQLVPNAECGCACLAANRDAYLLSPAEREFDHQEEVAAIKSKAVLYMLVVQQLALDYPAPGELASDYAGFACDGGILIRDLQQPLQQVNIANRDVVLTSVLIHELGHKFGLGHGGDEQRNNKPNYISLMNYAHVGTSSFSTTKLDELNEQALNESVGLTHLGAPYPPPSETVNTIWFDDTFDRRELTVSAGAIDWSLGQGNSGELVQADLNADSVCVIVRPERGSSLAWTEVDLSARVEGSDDRYTNASVAQALDWRSRATDPYLLPATPGTVPAQDDLMEAISVSNGMGGTVTRNVIRAGVNGVLDTPVVTGDQLRGFQIVAGSDGVCQTTAELETSDVVPPLWHSASNSLQGFDGFTRRQRHVLTGHNDLETLRVRRHIDEMGGSASLDIPAPGPGFPDLPIAVLQRLGNRADLIVSIAPRYASLAREVTYEISITNAGASTLTGGQSVQLTLPATATAAVCTPAAGLTCGVGRGADGTAKLARLLFDTLPAGTTLTAKLSMKLESTSCSTPAAYDLAVASGAKNIDPNPHNNNYRLPFPDSDGDGKPDVCDWAASDFAIYGLERVDLGAQIAVLSNVPGAQALTAQRASSQLRINANSYCGTVLGNGGVFLGSNTTLTGDLVCGGALERQNGVHIEGAERPGNRPEPELPSVALAVVWSAYQPGRVEVPNGGASAPAPGRYDQLVVRGNGELALSCGDYYFEELLLESSSRVLFDPSGCQIRVFVHRDVTLRANWAAPEPHRILLAYGGTHDVHITVPVGATILAPRARVTLAQPTGMGLTGAVIARDVQVQGGAMVIYEPFTGDWPL